ncbi:MAG: hypothetical protein LAO03_05375 [Acidobacteriia bacterium]|nr:hypothetical protein [Terriglobia bacterium]
MRSIVYTYACLAVCLFPSLAALGQQVSSPTPVTVTSPSPAAISPATEQNQSLADVARKLRSNKPVEVKMSAEDAKELFRSVDKIFAFASQDTGFPQRSVVKRQLISQSDVENLTRERLAKVDFVHKFERTEMTMKKFGFLPRDFKMEEFAVKSNGQNIAAFYDEETKSISMLNWIPLEQQRPILAHELTHALQDQNFDLKKWASAGHTTKKQQQEKATDDEHDEASTVRRAVVEGQAMVVYIDYLLAPYGRNLQNTPGVLASMEDDAVKAAVDTELLHNAPYVLRETGTFPYREGLIFEGELLARGGKPMAFAGAFAKPPRTTHEVIQPRAYLEGEKLPPLRIPDIAPLLAQKYETYDSGSIGELDVRALLEQYGERRIAPDLSASWQGGTYLALRRTGNDAASKPATSDLALLYVSRWKSPQAAAQFARIYAASVTRRYQSATPAPPSACAGAPCPTSVTQISTEEGPVIVEQWPDNTVIVSESFDAATAAQLSQAVREGNTSVHAQDEPQQELGFRLYDLPAFQAFRADIAARSLDRIENSNRALSAPPPADITPPAAKGACRPHSAIHIPLLPSFRYHVGLIQNHRGQHARFHSASKRQ